VGIGLARIYDSAITIRVKTFITYFTVIVPAPNVLAGDVLGTGNLQ
jgi:hypothetical protein